MAKSKIMAFFTRLSGAVYNKAKSSFVGGLLCGYDAVNEKNENGILKTLTSKLKLKRRFFAPVKRVSSRLFSQSILILKLRMFLWSFLSTRVNVYGLFFMTSGAGSLLVAFLKRFVLEKSALSFLDCFISVLLMILSLPLLFSNVCMAESIRSSRFLSGFLFDFLGISTVPFERKLKPLSHNNTAWVFGILFCVLSYVYRPHQILLFIVLVLVVTAALFTPETGVVCLFLVLPFLPQAYLVEAVLFIALCWFFKYIRGKRTFKADVLSVCVLIFAFMAWFACMISGALELTAEPMVTFLCAVLGFFLVENLIKSKEWLDRCMKASLASYFTVCFIGVLGIFLQYFDNSFIQSLVTSSNGENIFGFLLGMKIEPEYIIMLLPAAFSLMITTAKNKFYVSVGIVMGLVCLFSAYTYGAWIGAFMGLLLFFLVGGKKILATVFLLICFIPFIILFVSPSYLAQITNIGLFADRVNAWVGNIVNSFGVFNDYILGGSGLGMYERVSVLKSLGNAEHGLYLRMGIEQGGIGLLAFFAIIFFLLQKNITAYSKGCTSRGRLIALSNLSGIVSVLVMGIGGNVWEFFNVRLLFWLMLGMSSAAINIEKNNYSSEDMLYESEI